MTWHWPVLYVCIGLIGMLLTDDSVQAHDPDNPMGTRVMMCALWPVVVVALVVLTVWYWFEDDDDDQDTGW